MNKDLPVSISRARHKHVKALGEIEKLCFSDPWSPDMLSSQIAAEDGLFLLAENENDGILGYAACRTVLDEGYITNVAVHPEFRRHGVAALLLSTLIFNARKLELHFLTLEVRESNAPAIALYECFGFSRVGFRPNYYEKPREAAVLMTLFL